MIQEDTRIQKSGANAPVQKSLLDHLYVRNVDFISHVTVRNITGYDHSTIGCRLLHFKPPIKPKKIQIRKIKLVPEGEFQEHYLRSDFHKIFLQTDPDSAVKAFEDVVHEALDKVAPLKTIHFNPRFVPYMTDEIKDKMKDRLIEEEIR